MQTELFTIKEAAQILRISESFVYKLMRREILQPVRLGRTTRIHRREVERLAREGCALR